MQLAFTVWWKNGKTVKKFLWPKPKERWVFVDKKAEATKHRTEWCAAASKDRCMRCGRISEQMNMRRTREGSRWLGMDLNHKFGR